MARSGAVRRGEALAFGALFAGSAIATSLVPRAAWGQPLEPTWGAIVGMCAALLALVAIRLVRPRGSLLEQRVLAAFLIAMPLVYVSSWFRYGGGGWIWIELLGFVLYGSLAILGLRRSPWFLVTGIAAHGGWDLWHYRTSGYVPDWYAIACLAADVGVAVYAAMQVPFWTAARHETSGVVARAY